MSLRQYHYVLDDAVIRISAERRPYARPKPYSIRVLTNGKWEMPCFPEITGRRLEKFAIYLGCTPDASGSLR